MSESQPQPLCGNCAHMETNHPTKDGSELRPCDIPECLCEDFDDQSNVPEWLQA